jgi:polyhydroxybutyrate depolymerase
MFIAALICAPFLSGCGDGGSSPPASPNFTVSVPAAEENLSRYEISVQGLDREFYYFHPANPNHEKLPLVVYFHGAGGNMATEIANNAWIPIARREKFYFLAPQALSGPEPYTYWNVGWNIGRDDVTFIKTVIDQLVAQQDIDTDRIYVTGMSSGGHMAFYAGQRLQDSIAAVAPIAGSVIRTLLPNYSFMRPMPLCNIHGNADTIVSIYGGDWYASWSDIRKALLTSNNIDPNATPLTTNLPDINTSDNSTVTKFEYRGATIASDIDDYLINNGYHSVPGIQPQANQDINAYEVIWSFFLKHRLSDRL